MRRILTVFVIVSALLALGVSAVSAHHKPGHDKGVSGPAFYVDGELYRTVATPNDVPINDNNQHSFDIIYELHGVQPHNVSEVAPGYRDYNGGRWMVHGIVFDDYVAALAAHDANGSGDFDSDEEIEAAVAAGDATDQGILRAFVCPVIKLPQNS